MLCDLGLAHIVAKFDPKNETYLINQKAFLALLEAAIRFIPFDPEWYLSQYPDVKEAVAAKTCDSAFQHYLEHGFMECRLPYRVQVDEAFYLSVYADVRMSIENNIVPSAQWHFENHGRSEGRLPYREFTILRDALSQTAALMATQPFSDGHLLQYREFHAADHPDTSCYLPPRRQRREHKGKTALQSSVVSH